MASSRSKKGYGNYHSKGRIVKKNKKSPIKSLPRELLVEVLAKAAGSSLTAFFSAQQSSKVFQEVADERYVYKKIAIEPCSIFSWHRSHNLIAFNSFWEKCKNCSNPEALYLQGVVDYFGLGRQRESGLEWLNQAAELGHYGARYTLGIILLLSEDNELMKNGMEFLCDVKKSNTRLIECRKKLQSILGRIWTNDTFRRERSGICNMGHKYRKNSGWEIEDEDDIECEACRCEREVAAFRYF